MDYLEYCYKFDEIRCRHINGEIQEKDYYNAVECLTEEYETFYDGEFYDEQQ